MSSRWKDVLQWIERLREHPPRHNFTGLSKPGLRACIKVALDAVTPEALAQAAREPGEPWQRVGLVTTHTTATAPLEWLAVLLGRGSEVVWVSSDVHPGLSLWMCAHSADLPLRRVARFEELAACDFIVVFGDASTARRLQPFIDTTATVYVHGSSWSGVWVTGSQELQPVPGLPASMQDTWGRIAADAALHDGRGCRSPHIIFTPLSREAVLDPLADAMARAEQLWPRGTVYPAEASFEHARESLARVVGDVRVGEGWSVHAVPEKNADCHSAPRSLLVVPEIELEAALDRVRGWSHDLLLMGTDTLSDAPKWASIGAHDVVPIGEMQRPPLHRVEREDGWMSNTVQPPSPR